MAIKKISIAEYISQQIAFCGKSQKDIAEEMGYTKPNIITMFKQGKTKIPVNKVPAFAKAIGVDQIHMLRLVMNEYMEDTWGVIELLLGGNLLSASERSVIDLLRKESEGLDIAPETEEERLELSKLFQKMKERKSKLVEASSHRVEID